MSSSLQMRGPFRPKNWSLGGLPSKHVDIPVSAVFLALFIAGAATHMTIFQRNKRRGHKFIFNAALFGFCMTRILSTVLRIASVARPENIRLTMTAQIFVAAGIIILFLVNLFWTHRLIRSMHPHIGWHKAADLFFYAIVTLIFFSLIILVTAVVQSFFTLRPRTLQIDRDLQLYGATYFAFVATLPLPLILASLLLPCKGPLDPFGTGRHSTKVVILLTGSALCALGAWYRAATQWMAPVPLTQPMPPYFHKACFYVFDFSIEIVVVALYALTRVDQRFYVPDGAKGSGSYSRAVGTLASSKPASLSSSEEAKGGMV